MAMSLPRTRDNSVKEKVLRRPWVGFFNLAYDGGGETWVGYYRTLFGAKFSLWWHYYVASYGGKAEVKHNDWPGRIPPSTAWNKF